MLKPMPGNILLKRAKDNEGGILQPLDDRILVRRLKSNNNALIVLTDAPPAQMAEVVAVGPGKWRKNATRQPIGVKVGDVILVPGVANQFPDWTDGATLLIREGDIAGIVEPGQRN